MIYEIKHRFTGAVLWSGEAGSMRAAVVAAVAARAYLAGADLAGANLARAYLAGADLADADLAGAYLAGAYLAGAYLAGADLADANLARADLAGANLARAYLAGADLADANLADADLAGAYLAGAYLAGADLAGADLAGAYLADANLAFADLAGANLAGAYLAGARTYDPSAHTRPAEPYVRKRRTPAERAADYRDRHPNVPIVEHLDQRILDAIAQPGASLDMSDWHSCETTHCRAGWAIHLAGAAGYALEKELGNPALAGRAIYRASTGRSPHFYASNAHALEDIKRCAAEDAKT